MGEEKVVLTILQYNMLVKKLEIYENKLKEINITATNLAEFNPTYERIRLLSEVQGAK